MNTSRHRLALPAGHRLHWYTLESVIGQGGFGITYLARDTNLEQPVAIKEFLPAELASRDSDSQVHPLTDGHTDTFSWGLSRFVTEAQTLARFRHPNIVRVVSVFEANNTAYMVMEYERGESLDLAWLKDDSDGSKDELPEPAVLAREAMTELEAAFEELRGILAELGEDVEEEVVQ